MKNLFNQKKFKSSFYEFYEGAYELEGIDAMVLVQDIKFKVRLWKENGALEGVHK